MKTKKRQKIWFKVKGLLPFLSTLGLVLAFLALRGDFSKKQTCPLFFGKTEEMDEVLFSSDEGEIKIKKEAGEWLIEKEGEERPANEEKVTDLLEKAGKIKLDDLVSTNMDKAERFGLGEKDKIKLVMGGKTLWVGKAGPDWQSSYVREDGIDKIYKVGVNLKDLLDFSDWEKTKITNLSSYQLTRIEISEEGDTRKFKKKEGKWTEEGEGAGEVDEEKMEALADTVAHLDSVGLISDFGDRGEDIKIKATTEGGDEVAVSLGHYLENSEQKYWATTDGNWYFEISGEDFEALSGF